MTQGCVVRCLDPDCNLPTFDAGAVACSHCGGRSLQIEHPGSMFDEAKQAFFCTHCESEADADLLVKMRLMTRTGELNAIAPGFADRFDVTDH